MKTYSPEVLAALASGEVGIVQMIEMAFPVTPIRLNSSNMDLMWGGHEYKGAYGLGQISPITDKPGEVQGITLELHGADDARISLALDEADIVQGTPLTLRTAIISLDTFTILDAPIDWVGTLDTMATAEDGETASISVTAESKAVDLLRGTVLMYTDADQRTINPTDGAFKYVVDQIDKPVIWPAKAFFQQ